jgi:hypothetical protein
MPVKTKEDISAMDMCLMIFKENNDFKNVMLEQMKQLIDITIENKQHQRNSISTNRARIVNDQIKNKSENNKLSCVCRKIFKNEDRLLTHKQNCNSYAIYASNNNIHNVMCNELVCVRSAIDVILFKCKQHGGIKRCNKPGCTRGAVTVLANGIKGRCFSHGGGNRCPNCITWPDSRGGSAKYDGYCATCFKRIFPDDERSQTIYSHTKEIIVRNKINNNFKGFIHDTPLYTGNCDCTHRRRIDHRKMFNDTILAVETDEFGHKGYDKHDEEIRYDDLYMIHSGKWIFIRFNPDTNVSKMDIEDKLDVLIEKMNECIDRIETGENTELVEIIKLFC